MAFDFGLRGVWVARFCPQGDRVAGRPAETGQKILWHRHCEKFVDKNQRWLGGVRKGFKELLLGRMTQDFGLMERYAPILNLMEGQNLRKMPKYLVLKGSKNLQGTCGAAKQALYTLIFTFYCRFKKHFSKKIKNMRKWDFFAALKAPRNNFGSPSPIDLANAGGGQRRSSAKILGEV